MNPETIAVWRNLALILLCLEAFILMLVPAVIFFFAQRYLRRFRHWLRTPILRVYVYTLRAQNVTLRASNAIAGVPISLESFGARLRTTARQMIDRGG